MKRLTPVKAIRQRCLDCPPDNRNDVRNCENKDCQLYPYRMGKRPTIKGKRPLLSIRKYCVNFCCLGSFNEVKFCPSSDCSLYFYRFGKRPVLLKNTTVV